MERCLTTIGVSSGTLVRLGEMARGLGFRRTLLVSDKGLLAAGIVDRAKAALAEAGIESCSFHDFDPSPDMQMVYLRLRSGEEFLHSVDAAWNMDNIRAIKGKAAPWVKEDVPAVMAQLAWLNGVMQREPSLNILVTHDGEWLDRMIARSVVGGALKL